MKVALTYNLKKEDNTKPEDYASEFDSEETIGAIACALRSRGHNVECVEASQPNLLEAFKKKTNFRVLVLPDHATPVALRTHTADTICFGIFGQGITGRGFLNYSEKESEKSDLIFENGYQLMDFFVNQDLDASPN